MYRGVGADVAIKTTTTNPIIDWINIDTGYGLLFFASTQSHPTHSQAYAHIAHTTHTQTQHTLYVRWHRRPIKVIEMVNRVDDDVDARHDGTPANGNLSFFLRSSFSFSFSRIFCVRFAFNIFHFVWSVCALWCCLHKSRENIELTVAMRFRFSAIRTQYVRCVASLSLSPWVRICGLWLRFRSANSTKWHIVVHSLCGAFIELSSRLNHVDRIGSAPFYDLINSHRGNFVRLRDCI